MSDKESQSKTPHRHNKLIAAACVIIILIAGAVLLFRGNSAAPGSQSATTGPTLYLSPESQSIGKSQTFTVNIWADSTDQKVNTVEADLKYATDTFELVKINGDKSSFKVGLPVKQTDGYISIVRGSTTPLKGNLLVAELTLQPKKAGSGSLSFTKDSKLFATGKTKDILAETKNGKYSVK